MALDVARVLMALGFGALLFVGYERDREQRAQLAALGAELRQARAESIQAPVRVPVIVPGGGPAPLDSATVNAIAERVAALSTAAVAPTAPQAEAGRADDATPEQAAARERIAQRLDRVMSERRLSREDVMAMRREMADDPTARRETVNRIVVAINRGEIVVDDPRFGLP